MALSTEARRALELNASVALFETHTALIREEPNANEPRHVCVMTQYGSLLLFHGWRDILAQAGVWIRVTGVFCHQTPKAHFPFKGGSASPELGDLLVVHDHLHATRPRRRALLVQAKMASAGRVTGPSNPEQEHLYRTWPDFRLRGLGARGTGTRFLDGQRTLRDNRRGCTHALIENRELPIGVRGHLLPPSWRFSRPGGVGPSRHAALVLTSMVLGRSGAGRAAMVPVPGMEDPSMPGFLAPNVPRNLHWSATVQELLDVTAAKALAAKMPGPLVPERGVTFCFMQAADFAYGGGIGDRFAGGGGHMPLDADGEEPGDGISLILIETSGDGLDEPMAG